MECKVRKERKEDEEALYECLFHPSQLNTSGRGSENATRMDIFLICELLLYIDKSDQIEWAIYSEMDTSKNHVPAEYIHKSRSLLIVEIFVRAFAGIEPLFGRDSDVHSSGPGRS